jgi:hypothetical protein
MIVRMPTPRPQQRYDHRLRDLVQHTGDLSIATAHGVRRSTARGWVGAAPLVVLGLAAADLTGPELRQEILKLRRRVEKLAALLRLALALLHTPGFSSQVSVCQTEPTSGGSSAPWIRRTGVCRCERSFGSWVCPRVGFTPGADERPRVRSTISRLVLGRHRID